MHHGESGSKCSKSFDKVNNYARIEFKFLKIIVLLVGGSIYAHTKRNDEVDTVFFEECVIEWCKMIF